MPMCASVETPMPTPSSAQRSAIFAAYGPMLSVDTVFKTMVVDLNNLVLGLSCQQHLVDIERHARTPCVFPA